MSGEGGKENWLGKRGDIHTCMCNFIWMHTYDHTLMYMYVFYNELRF